ncbi:hypothetical protein O181_114305 [Austropuccinia psidii MF-1]|uniref:Uncharacterized protein n=1 Tax=Austropuccinia psidii MF-1 TaxID=1389203 RepID=A0A9Q3K467_9BASI|nr:hypothetical protein [Austropuccinia psidii MF-1]
MKLCINTRQISKSSTQHIFQGTVKETLESQGTSQRTDKACPEPDDLEEDILDTLVDGKTWREIIPTLPFTFQFDRNLKPQDWKDIDQVLQLHQLLKNLFQWSINNKIFNLASYWEEIGAIVKKICLRDRLQRPYGNHQNLKSHQKAQTSGGEGNQDKGESSHYPRYRRTAEPNREYSDSFGLTRFSRRKRIQWQKEDLFQPKAKRVRPNDPEAVGMGEISTQEPEIVLHTSRISNPINRSITPTQAEHNVFTPESNSNSNQLLLQMFQFAVHTQRSLNDFKRINEMFQRNALLKEATIKAIQEGCSQSSQKCEENNKRLSKVFEEQHHCKRDRECLDQEINKMFNFYQSMKPQPEGHALEDPYHQEDIKPISLLVNKAIYLSQGLFEVKRAWHSVNWDSLMEGSRIG